VFIDRFGRYLDLKGGASRRDDPAALSWGYWAQSLSKPPGLSSIFFDYFGNKALSVEFM